MRGIIIAAGLGMRLRPMTEQLPKCMLPIVGRPLLHHTMRYMRSAGCQEFVVIVGHSADKVDADGATLVTNTDYENNNILHSLMYALVMNGIPISWCRGSIRRLPREPATFAWPSTAIGYPITTIDRNILCRRRRMSFTIITDVS